MSRFLVATACVAAAAVGPSAVLAQSTYTEVGSYARPSNTLAIGPDGLLWALNGTEVLRQAAINSATFDVVGSLNAGGSVLSISPDGTRLVVVDGTTVRAALISSLSTSSSTATINSTVPGGRFRDGVAWTGNNLLVGVATPFGGPGVPATSQILRLDFGTGLTPAITVAASIDGSGTQGGSIGVGLGRVYWTPQTGGDDSSRTRGYDLATLLASPTPLGDSPTDIRPFISRSFTGVDGNGAVIVGDVRSGMAVATAYNPATGASILDFSSAFGFPIGYNSTTGELLIAESRIGRGSLVVRYSIPAPGFGAALLIGGLAVARRRR
jgi:hypothetical protein